MRQWRSIHSVLLATTALVPLGLAGASANPNGPQVVGGAASVSGVGTSHVTVTQTTDRAAINWQQFNIGAGERTQFIQPSSTSIALNRVTGGLGPSQILGSLTANGRIFLVNPDGILFGAGATIDTAGFLATTNDIKNSDFMAGRYDFTIPGRPDASIVNLGTINANNQGFAALVAPGVRNSGTITARLGKIGLASGNGFSLDFYGDKLITLAVNDSISADVKDVATGQPLGALVKNEGKLSANGGRVEISAVAARKIVGSVINNKGVIEARSIGTRNGKIVLGAVTTKVAGGPKQTVKLAGKLTVASRSGTGGKIQVTGENIEVTGATINASGATGGGKVLIGGDVGGGNPHWAVGKISQAALEAEPVTNATTVSVDATSTIDASATTSGDGGKVVVWADGDTSFAGAVKATGGASAGNGGFVEVSGKHKLAFSGAVNTSAANGAFGTLLLDPYNLRISSNASSGMNGFSANANDSVLNVTALQNALAGNNVVVTTGSAGTQDGDIVVANSFSWSSASTLTLSAHQDVLFDANVVVSSTGAGSLNLQADNTGTGVGTVAFGAGAGVTMSGSGNVFVYYNPATFGSPDFQANAVTVGSGNLTAHMLVNDWTNFNNIRTFFSQAFALGIDLVSPGGNFTPFSFSGVLDGLSHKVSNIQVAGPAPITVNSGTIRNLTFENASVTANANNQNVGLLAGQNVGSISKVTVSGTVLGSAHTGLAIGGLVGQNGGMNNSNSTVLGKIDNSHSSATVTAGSGFACFNNCSTGFNMVGGLVGFNAGEIADSSASGLVSVGGNTFAGGLVGSNQVFVGSNNVITPKITGSFATGAVNASGVNVQIGGLVGYNSGQLGNVARSGQIIDSRATGAVTATAAVVSNCNLTPGSCEPVNGGGLVGYNQGLVESSATLAIHYDPAVGSGTYATGAVNVGSNSIAGGLVGQNHGRIVDTKATGNVTGAAGTLNLNDDGPQTTLGGLVGNNAGTITGSEATGNVGDALVDRLQVGGLVGHNQGRIESSTATIGFVRAGNDSQAGGLVSSSGSDFQCSNSCDLGLDFNEDGFITGASSDRAVTVGSRSLAGGLVGVNSGLIESSQATGAVTGADNSVLGGLVGAIDVTGMVDFSEAAGAVASTGPNSWVGGLAGVNFGIISGLSSASNAVTATSDSHVGGLVGLNAGSIAWAGTDPASTVTGAGANNVVGGLVGTNFGTVVFGLAQGTVSGGANNIVGGLVGANAALGDMPLGLAPSTFPLGMTLLSSGIGTVSGGPGSKTGSQVGVEYPTSLPQHPSILASCHEAVCDLLRTGTLHVPQKEVEPAIPPDAVAPPVLPPITNQPSDPLPALIALTTTAPAADPTTTGSTNTTNPAAGPYAPPQSLRPVAGPDGERFSSVPPLNETRFFNDEVVLQIGTDISASQVEQLAQQLGLSVIATQSLGSLNRTAFRFRITNGQSVRDIIRRLEANSIVAVAQPNYRFTLTEPARKSRRGDPAQYMTGKLHLEEAHQVAAGEGVTIAVIDSQVDRDHSELIGVIADQYNAVGADEQAHSHGTAMVGAIASRDRLLGVAPNVRVLAIRAFSDSDNSAEGTTFNIIKSIDWAVSQGARVINMSFAGPHDPSVQRALKAAYDKGVVLIAAAGNAGPKSAPLFPAADPSVIGVTATDPEDRVFRQANRGGYVAVAAPGVDILAPSPQAGYQLSTGTSIATAHVTGVVALMLERDPSLKPAEVRRILESTAVDLGPRGRDAQFGWGLVDPRKALEAVRLRGKQADAATGTMGRAP